MSAKYMIAILGIGLLPLAGCLSPVRHDTDALICHRASLPVDALPLPTAPVAPVPQSAVPQQDQGIEQVGVKVGLIPLAGQPMPKQNLEQRLIQPRGIPGEEAPPIVMKGKPGDKSLQEAIDKYFPAQAALGPDPRPGPGPEGRPMTLADLQRLARANSPLLRQAASDIKSAEGAALQAGLYPNPTVGISTNSIGANGGPMFGPTISQTIKTMGKLKLAEAAAAMDLANSQLAYRRAETDLMAQVRSGYFTVLAAEKAIRTNHALVDLTDEVYKVMILQLKIGDVATYEPFQVGVLAAQARAGLIQARNSYLLAWKQLAASLGLPTLAAAELEGRIDQNLPRFDYEKALAHVLANHTDTLTARYTIEKARYLLRLAQVTPIPDVTLQATVSYDATPPGPPRIVTFAGGSIPLGVFDRNQGGIRQAQGQLLRANEEPHRVQDDLTSRLAEAYRRVEENRVLLELNRTRILPQSVQAFRAAVKRHYGAEPDKVAYADLITAEQAVVTVVGTYLTIQQAYWQAVSDLASLLQTDDVYQMAAEIENCPAPDLAELLRVPCCHPCSPLPSAPLKTMGSDEAPSVPDGSTSEESSAPPVFVPAALGRPTTFAPGAAGRKL